MYCSLDKIDLTARVEGQPVAIQADERQRAEIEAAPELSALFAMTRVLNARGQLAERGHPDAAVHYVVADEPPPVLREALTAVGATIERADRKVRGEGQIEPLGPGSQPEASTLADRCFAALARRVARRVGSRDLAIALRMLEDQTFAAPPGPDDEPGYWARVLELAALAGELLRAKYPGHWIQTDRALVPFGFQLPIAAGGEAVMLPTNRAQRVIEDGRDESLFKLLVAADETVHRPCDAATGRLMPSLRHRRDVELDEVVWRPIGGEQGPLDLPIVVCGIDGETTFGMIRRAALDRTADEAFDQALVNLATERVDCEELELGGLPIAIVSGSFYAAEKLLDRGFMHSLHRKLDATLLAAATPARGCLLVAEARRDPASIARFAAIVQMRFDEAGGRAISPAIVLVEGGQITGHVRRPDEREPRADTATARADTAPAMTSTGVVAGFLRRLLGRK